MHSVACVRVYVSVCVCLLCTDFIFWISVAAGSVKNGETATMVRRICHRRNEQRKEIENLSKYIREELTQ